MNDKERMQLATLENGWMVGPWEQDRCPHGRMTYFRWFWAPEESPETGEIEAGKNGCAKCAES